MNNTPAPTLPATRVSIYRRTAWSRGFTLVELLVVIAIIGVLVGLLLPAVQAAREAARRMQCTNNLKQIGLALHMHHDTHNKFPAGYIQQVSGGPAPPFVGYHDSTWVYFLFPFLEQQALYDLVDSSANFGSAPSAALQQVFSTTLPAMLCPSDVEVDLLSTSRNRARGNYVANNGIGPMVSWWLSSAATRGPDGVFVGNKRYGFRDLLDGSSNTVLVSELLKVPGEDYRGMMHYTEGPFYHHNQTPNTNIPDTLRITKCVNIDRAPCTETYTGHTTREISAAARSLHPGGVQALLGDGSVRFVSDSIHAQTWQWLGTPQDGNVLNEF